MATRTIGASKVTSTNGIPRLLARMAVARAVATRVMAEEAQHQAEGVYAADGDGQWAPNAPGTVDWKGFDGPMHGRTGTLAHDIRIQPSPNHPTGLAVGWFDDPHPDTDGRLSEGALATVHEYGSGPENPADIPARLWLSQVADQAHHEEAVLLAGRAAYQGAL